MGSALERQVGGDHYINSTIQPIEYIHVCVLEFCVAHGVALIETWDSFLHWGALYAKIPL